MVFRFQVLLLLMICSFSQLKAQTIGAYGSTFSLAGALIPYSSFSAGPGCGIFMNGFLKGRFNPGIDIQYVEKKTMFENTSISLDDYPYYGKKETDDTFHYSSLERYLSITSLILDLEFTSPQEDTFVISFGVQPGIALLRDKMSFDNPNLPDQMFSSWTPSLGASGTIRRNYIFGTPLQLFITISAQQYKTKRHFNNDPITYAFQEMSSITVGYAKIGLAYKL